jgi:hypothetical protein
MQCCDVRSLLTLARCSQFTLASASSDFAWRSIPSINRYASLHHRGPLLRISSSLLRFTKINVFQHEHCLGSLDTHCTEVSVGMTHDAMEIMLPQSALTYLSVDGQRSEMTARQLMLIARCKSLIKLRLKRLHEGALEPLLSHPSLARLQTLSLTDVYANRARGLRYPPSRIDWENIFSALRELHRLRLTDVWEVDLVLKGLLKAPLLRSLVLQPKQRLVMESRPSSSPTQMPSLDLLKHLLRIRSRPALRIELPSLQSYCVRSESTVHDGDSEQMIVANRCDYLLAKELFQTFSREQRGRVAVNILTD